MEYDRLDMLQSAPAQETTAVTLKSIKEILAETGPEGLLQHAPAPEPAAAALPHLQRPPVHAPALQRPPVPGAHVAQPVPVQPRRVPPPQFPTLQQPMQEDAAAARRCEDAAHSAKPTRQGLVSRLFRRG